MERFGIQPPLVEPEFRNSIPILPYVSELRVEGYARHFVPLSWVDAATDGNEIEKKNCRQDVVFISGFVLSVKGNWFWITAGHVLKDMKQRFASGRRIIRMKFCDLLSSRDSGVPFPYEHQFDGLYDESEGYDYGAIPLSLNVRSLLKNGGVIPLDERWWQHEEVANWEVCEGVGVPTEDLEATHKQDGKLLNARVRACVAPIRIETNPPEEFLKPFPRLFGRLIDKNPDGSPNGAPLNKYDGMSGGPIFGLQRIDEHSVRYGLVGIQSKWVESQRLIIACPINPLINLLEQWIKHKNEVI